LNLGEFGSLLLQQSLETLVALKDARQPARELRDPLAACAIGRIGAAAIGTVVVVVVVIVGGELAREVQALDAGVALKLGDSLL